MKTKILFIILFASQFLFINQGKTQTLSLLEVVVEKNPDDSAPIVDANNLGGTMQFVRNYSSSCRTNYMIRWTFSKDLSVLNNGDEFDITIECLSCNSSCGKKWTSANASGSNNMRFPIAGKYPSAYNQNITLVESTGSVQGWSPGNLKHSYKLRVAIKKEADFTGFYIIMGDHKVNYIYGEGVSPSGPINCHTLLGLGKNLYSLEYGALDNKDISTWMIPTLDNALNHVKASNCLSPTYLTGLKSRLAKASSSLPFYGEISAYALSVESEIITACSCCVSCNND